MLRTSCGQVARRQTSKFGVKRGILRVTFYVSRIGPFAPPPLETVHCPPHTAYYLLLTAHCSLSYARRPHRPPRPRPPQHRGPSQRVRPGPTFRAASAQIIVQIDQRKGDAAEALGMSWPIGRLPGDGGVYRGLVATRLLARDVPGGRVQRAGRLIREDHHIPGRLHPGGNGPLHVVGIEDVDVFIHHDHVFQRAVPAERGLRGPATVVGTALADLHHGMKPRGPARRDVNVFHVGHLFHRGVDARLFGHAHEQFVLQLAGQQAMIERAPPVGDGVDLDDGLLAHDVAGLGEIDEGAFGG